jgi:hypothetical protein
MVQSSCSIWGAKLRKATHPAQPFCIKIVNAGKNIAELACALHLLSCQIVSRNVVARHGWQPKKECTKGDGCARRQTFYRFFENLTTYFLLSSQILRNFAPELWAYDSQASRKRTNKIYKQQFKSIKLWLNNYISNHCYYYSL